MNKDFVEVVNDSGSNNGSFDVVCGQNSENERSTILTVSGGGVSKTVAVKQAGPNLQGLDVQLICNGAIYTGIIESDVVRDNILEINVKLQHVLSAGGQMIGKYRGYVGFNKIGGVDAVEKGLPTFTKICYVEETNMDDETQFMDIVPKLGIPSTIYGPSSDSDREYVAGIINMALISNSANKTFFVLKNNICKVIFEFETTIQAIEIDGKLFVGNEKNFEYMRTFALLGDSPENNPEYINLYQANADRIARLDEVRFNYNSDVINPNVDPNVLKTTFVSYLIANSSDQTTIANSLEYLSSEDIILSIVGMGASDTVTLSNKVIHWDN
jgi:hypothetical protein|nr:MAG TPA: hypothetical protein [Crassvirales sp.]